MEQPSAVARTIRVEFTGNAGEYFRIWIVNVFLTIITLGIYSAWAKVRRNRYLYSSTRLAGASFEYLAQPLQILKGRLIAVGLLMVYMASGLISPLLQLAEMLVLMGFLPWLVVRARAFVMRNTAYRNIKFDFHARYGETAVIYLLWPLIVAVSLGMLYPLYVQMRARYSVENSSFGAQRFAFDARPGAYYWAYFRFLLLLCAALAGGGALVAGAFASMAEDGGGTGAAVLCIAVVVAVLALLASLTYAHVAVTNLTWSSIAIGGMHTRSELRVPRMFWVAFSSMTAIILTFGLLIPWATIRMARYRVEQMYLLNAEGLQALLGAKPGDVGAAGEELSDLIGVDIAL